MITWVPPKSPFDLLQERFWPDSWKILVTCLLLNQTSRKQVEPMIAEFFKEYPDPESMTLANEEKLKNHLRPLGLSNRRAKTLIRFSREYLAGAWDAAIELYGCGKYANDTWRIFCVGDWKNVQPNDHALNDYHGWFQTNSTSYNTESEMEET